MLGNYLIIALRNMMRHKTGTLINIGGLAIGIASCILIMMWVQFEFSYNDFHENLDDLYLLHSELQHGADRSLTGQSPPRAATAVLERCPAVVNSTRFNGYGQHVLKFEENCFVENLHRADAGFFTMFSFKFLAGDPRTAFADRNSIVLTASLARKYFGEEDALGHTIQMDYNHDMLVTGVVEDVPANSTLGFEALIPFEFLTALPGRENYLTTWYNLSFHSYVQLHPGTDWQAFNEVINDQAKPDNPEENLRLRVYPFRDLNLHSISGQGGFITVLTMFGVIAGVILLIACINYMNLATARAGNRAKEVGVRKVIGAGKGELITQFYAESILQAVLALGLSLVLVEQFLPAFQKLVFWSDLSMDYFGNPMFLLGVIAVTLVTGLVAGSYPALILSSFKPVDVLRGTLRIGVRGALPRRILVVLQFGAAVVLIICTIFVYRQFEFMRYKPLGHDVENIVYFRMHEELKPHFDALKADLEGKKNIVAVTKANRPLAGIYTNGHNWDWEGRDPQINPLVTYFSVGLGFQEVFGIELAEGRFFSESDRGKGGTDVIINQAFADMLGPGSALGKKLRKEDYSDTPNDGYTVIGVTKDFHFKPVYNPIQPLLIDLGHDRSNNYAFIKITGEDIPGSLDAIKHAFHQYLPDQLFDYSFAAEGYENMYRSVTTRGNILGIFAVLAVLLSCLGLLGLALHMTEQRAKEIGIRKVLGASVGGVTLLLTKEFVRWVIVANLLAWPVAYHLSHSYLQNFSYKVDISWQVFAQVTLLTVLLAIVTVSFRSVQAALADPVESIRRE